MVMKCETLNFAFGYILSRLVNKTNKTTLYTVAFVTSFRILRQIQREATGYIRFKKSRMSPSPYKPSPPNTSLAQAISRPHEDAVKGDECTNPAVRSKSNRRMFNCQDKSKIPHETSLLFGH